MHLGRKVLLPLLAAVLLAAGALLLWRSGFFASARSLEDMRAYIARFAPFSQAAFFLLQLLAVVLAPIPSNILALAGAALFGLWPAYLLTMGAVLSGSVLVFLLARWLGRPFADRLVSQKISVRYLAVIRRKRDVFLFLALLLPFFPDDILCILAGLTDIPLRRFFLIVLFARPWGLLAACGVGASALGLPPWGMALLGGCGLLLCLVCLKFGGRWERALLERFRR